MTTLPTIPTANSDTFDAAAENLLAGIMAQPTKPATASAPTETAPDADFDTPQAPAPSETVAMTVEDTGMTAEETAESVVGLLDMINTNILPLAVDYCSYTRQELRSLKNLAARLDYDGKHRQATTLTPEEIELMSIFSETQAEKDALLFNKQERALLVKRFIPIFKTATVSVSPTHALYVTLGTIMFPRALIMFNSYQRIGERNARNFKPNHNNDDNDTLNKNYYDDHTHNHQ